MNPSNSGSIPTLQSGFNVHAGKPIDVPNGGSHRTPGTVYEAEGPLPLEQIHFNADDQSVTIDGGEGVSYIRPFIPC